MKIRKDARYPLLREGPEPWPKRIIWINIIRTDWRSVLLLAFILLLAFQYKHDLNKCDDMMTRPCWYCNNTGCCRALAYQPVVLDDNQIPKMTIKNISTNVVIYHNATFE